MPRYLYSSLSAKRQIILCLWSSAVPQTIERWKVITRHKNVCLCLNQPRSSQWERAKLVGDCVTHSAPEAQGLKGFRSPNLWAFPLILTKIKYSNNNIYMRVGSISKLDRKDISNKLAIDLTANFHISKPLGIGLEIFGGAWISNTYISWGKRLLKIFVR